MVLDVSHQDWLVRSQNLKKFYLGWQADQAISHIHYCKQEANKSQLQKIFIDDHNCLTLKKHGTTAPSIEIRSV